MGDGAAKVVKVDHPDADLHAQVSLPFPVNGDSGSATFDTESSMLILTLPVLEPESADKSALQHLEANNAGVQTVNVNAASDGEDQEKQECAEPPMVRAQKLRGMALPRRLGDSMMF